MIKKGQMQISFGVIFSVIIIAATLATAGYIIVHFINVDKGIECQTYNKALQEIINDAWASDGSVTHIFDEGSNVPAKTQKVCFGNANQSVLNTKDSATITSLKNAFRNGVNMVFYPSASCGQNKYSFTLQHIKTDGLFCVDVKNGKAQVRYAKGVTDSLVKLCPITGNCTIGDSVVSNSGSVSGIIAPGSF